MFKQLRNKQDCVYTVWNILMNTYSFVEFRLEDSFICKQGIISLCFLTNLLYSHILLYLNPEGIRTTEIYF